MDKVTRQCPQTTNHFEEKGEPKRYRTEILPLTSLTPYHYANGLTRFKKTTSMVMVKCCLMSSDVS